MSKLTRRFKKNKKNKTIKKGGAFEEDTFKERQGVIDILGNTAKDVASFAAAGIADTALKFAGLERIKEPSEEQQMDSTASNVEKIDDTISNSEEDGNKEPSILCTVLDAVDRTGGLMLNEVNDILASEQFKHTTEEAAKQTADLIRQSSKTFNDTLNDPEVKAELEEAIKKAGQVSEMVIKYGEKPYNRAVDIAAKAAQKAYGAVATGSIKVGTDALAAVPFLGSVVSVGNMVNDTSKAASALTEAGSDVVQSASDVFIDLKKKLENDPDFLEAKKKLGEQISNRINKSIAKFKNSDNIQNGGGHKTRRKLFNRNAKSKRVRFNI